jgi:hypothetical protein
MALWLGFSAAGKDYFGTLDGDRVSVWHGDMFADPQPTELGFPLAEVRVLAPLPAGQDDRPVEQLPRTRGKGGPAAPRASALFPQGQPPASPPMAMPSAARRAYAGAMVFEAELGIVIGKRVSGIGVAAAPAAIFGYTCVNDVTARDLMRLDPAFVHWTRAKSFDSFGPFGPVIASGLDPAGLRVRAIVAGRELQNYAVSRHVLLAGGNRQPHLARHDAGTRRRDRLRHLGRRRDAMADGDTVEVVIDGVGTPGQSLHVTTGARPKIKASASAVRPRHRRTGAYPNCLSGSPGSAHREPAEKLTLPCAQPACVACRRWLCALWAGSREPPPWVVHRRAHP